MTDEPNPFAPPQSRIEKTANPDPRSHYPLWVKLSIWGVSGRTGLWVFVAICLATAAACFAYGFWNSRFFLIGAVSLFGASMYWLSILWIDRHGSWATDE